MSSKKSKLLPLWEGARPCVRCGHCCKIRSCGFGAWDPVDQQCSSLVQKKDGTYECGIFDQIVNGKDKTWYCAPAFGAGCCSSMNPERQEILARMRRRK